MEELIRFIRAGNIAGVTQFLDEHPDIDINQQPENADTPLNVAIDINNFEIVTKLVEKGASVNKSGISGKPLYHACRRPALLEPERSANYNICSVLITQGANVNDKMPHSHDTPLHMAAEMGKQDVCVLLIENEADVNALDTDNRSALTRAATNTTLRLEDRLATCEVLINSKADVNIKFEGNTLLNWAIRNIPSLCASLIRKGADVNARYADGRRPLLNGRTPLSLAAGHDNIEVCALLIKYGADVNAKDPDGKTPLHISASRNDSIDVCALLIEKGADVNAKYSKGKTPLIEALINNREPVNEPHVVRLCELLIRNGADVNEGRSNDGDTPLHIAVVRNSIPLSALLLGCKVVEGTILDIRADNRAEVNVFDSKHKFPIEYADGQLRELLIHRGGREHGLGDRFTKPLFRIFKGGRKTKNKKPKHTKKVRKTRKQKKQKNQRIRRT